MGIALTLALIAALAAWGWKISRKARLERALCGVPGGSAESAIEIASFNEVDEYLSRRRCICGGGLENKGERSERHDPRVLRVVRAECRLCDRRQLIFFDVSRVYH